MKRALTDLQRKKSSGGNNFSDSILSRVKSKNWEKDEDIAEDEVLLDNKAKWKKTLVLAFQAIGIIYGDIGTSPLYVISSTFTEAPPSPEDTLGLVSLIIWTLTAILVIKYCIIVLHADDNGQGGTFALFSILKRQAELGKRGELMASDRKLSQYKIGRGDTSIRARLSRPVRSNTAPPGGLPTVSERAPLPGRLPGKALNDWRQRLIQNKHTQNIIRVLVVLGVGMIMGDGVLTPAISVVSACEGLQEASTSITRTWIVVISIIIIACLFLIQQFGTGFVGSLFSPVIIVWFVFNTVINLYNIIVYQPSVFRAIGPNYWFAFFLRNGTQGWNYLGGVVLCITGTEALFADMGHFSRPAIQLSTLCLVYPALVITYMGQGAYIMTHPDAYDSAFWKSLPNGTFWPGFVIATLAAIIASQALISAVFQIVKQAIAQGFFPRFHVYHTSREHQGQVYIPLINYLLMTLCLIIVGTFKTSVNIGKAYGLAVLCDMFLTTNFMTLILITVWRVPLLFAACFYFFAAPIEGTYLSSTVQKIPTGGWFSLMMSCIYASMMLLWFWGSSKKKAFYSRKRLKLGQLLSLMGDQGRDHQSSMTIAQQKIGLRASQTALKRVRGVGLYYGEDIYGVPPVLLQFVSRTPVLYEVNMFVTIRFVPIPEVLESERMLVEQLGVSGFYHVICRYGYMEVVKQDEAWVELLLGRVLHLLYRTLQDRCSRAPTLHHDLGLPESYKVPPPGEKFEEDVGSYMDCTLPKSHAMVDHHNSRGASGDLELAKVMGQNGHDGQEAGSNGAVPAAHGDNGAAAAEDGAQGVQFREAGALERNLSLHPDDPPPEPFVYRNLEEIAEKLALAPAEVAKRHHRASIVADEIRIVKHAAAQHNVVFVMGHAHVVLPKNLPVWHLPRRVLLEIPYKMFADAFSESADSVFGVPSAHLLEIGLPYKLHES